MNGFALPIAVAALIVLVVLVELASAVLPIVIIIAFVPPEERHSLAEVIAAANSSRKLRIWTALRTAVKARRSDSNAPGSKVQAGEPVEALCRRRLATAPHEARQGHSGEQATDSRRARPMQESMRATRPPLPPTSTNDPPSPGRNAGSSGG